MTVKELIKKLSSFNSDSQVLVRFMDGDRDGSCWPDMKDFDEDDVTVEDDVIVLDIT